MAPRIEGIRDVAERHLCCGCGACAYAQPEAVRMVDVLDQGRRPEVRRVDGKDLPTAPALEGCPGLELRHEPGGPRGEEIAELHAGWGAVLEVWEGYAADPELRYLASSGGAATALALHCVEREGMHGVLHIKARDDVPYLNHTVLSHTRAELLEATGSRYAPASPCDSLDRVEAAPAPCVFIGKPCDVAATSMLRATRPRLDEKLGLTIAIFCAGTPSTAGTLEMMRELGVEDPSRVRSVRYRGKGWPGMAEVQVDGTTGDDVRRASYDESWGKILQKHRQWRCYVCADHTGEFADVAVGDPWYREIPPEEPGRSLVVVRTERGRRLVRAALAAGALALERVDPGLLPASQINLLHTRGAVWGRSLVCRLMGVAAPRFHNFPLLGVWWRDLSLKQKARSLYGTAKRVFTKRLRHRRPVRPFDPRAERAPNRPPAA